MGTDADAAIPPAGAATAPEGARTSSSFAGTALAVTSAAAASAAGAGAAADDFTGVTTMLWFGTTRSLWQPGQVMVRPMASVSTKILCSHCEQVNLISWFIGSALDGC